MITDRDLVNGRYSGGLYLEGYAHPLPAGLTSVGGYLDLRGYAHPLSASLVSVGGGLGLGGYVHPLPESLASVGGYLVLEGYAHPLPAALASVGGDLVLGGYAHPLPAALASVGGNLHLYGYAHPLPAGLLLPGAPPAADLRRRVAEHIEAHPELHDQAEWGDGSANPACGTPCCVAGWACHLGGGDRGLGVQRAAERLLHLPGKPMPSFEGSASRIEILAALRG